MLIYMAAYSGLICLIDDLAAVTFYHTMLIDNRIGFPLSANPPRKNGQVRRKSQPLGQVNLDGTVL